jgi:hypothetical protein
MQRGDLQNSVVASAAATSQPIETFVNSEKELPIREASLKN